MTIRNIIEKLKNDNCSSNPGDEYRSIYRLEIVDGKETLVQCDMVDIQAEINAYEPSVNIQNVLARYGLGDEEAINKVQGFYGDVTSVPKDFAEFFNVELKAKQLFEELPVDIKELFDGDYRKLILEPDRIQELYKNIPDVDNVDAGSGEVSKDGD